MIYDQNHGIGTQCMQTLKYDLYQQGIQQLDTDTASTNLRAQHFYIKNQFHDKGITRSYIKD